MIPGMPILRSAAMFLRANAASLLRQEGLDASGLLAYDIPAAHFSPKFRDEDAMLHYKRFRA